ncbi:MAG: hypothetical protein O8C66_15795 [Candidatus Methanoperedens sp.]|nr:hypothetical protein [Candidatus Methanoperedens sp.]MCZ7371960.1 hypothetical protein [Candidatus Methanoperedens sp.]
MVKKSEMKKEEGQEKKDVFKVWADSYTAVSKMWEESYMNLYKPWIETTGEMFEKAVELSKEATPEKYKEFYDEWIKAQQKTFGKIYPIPMQKSDRETLEKLLVSAEEANNLFKSWVAEIEENTQRTQDLLKGTPDPEKYRDHFNMWMKSYEKIFDEFISMPAMESTKEIFGNYGGIPNMYLKNFAEMSKIWKNSFSDLYLPWVDPMFRLSGKTAELSRGNATPEDYKEFYNLWMKTYQETYGKMFNVQSMKPSKEMLENFLESTNIYLNMYKTWIAAMEKMSEKVKDLSGRTSDPEAYKEFYDLWVTTYEKAFEDFFENMPTIGPMKKMMEPVKSAAKIYADTFANMSNMWIESFPSTARA